MEDEEDEGDEEEEEEEEDACERSGADRVRKNIFIL